MKTLNSESTTEASAKTIQLDEKSWAKLMDMINRPPEPTNELKALMRLK